MDIEIKKNKFIDEKNDLENILDNYKSKILFPKEFIYDIGKIYGLQHLKYYIKAYNTLIKKSRHLSKKLKLLLSWSYIFNTHKNWIKSVSSIKTKIEKFKKKIIKCLEKKSELVIKSLLIKFEFSYWLNKLVVFMNTSLNYNYIKENNNNDNNKNMFICEINLENKKKYYGLNLYNINKLLPLFLNSKFVEKKINYHDCYYKITDCFC